MYGSFYDAVSWDHWRCDWQTDWERSGRIHTLRNRDSSPEYEGLRKTMETPSPKSKCSSGHDSNWAASLHTSLQCNRYTFYAASFVLFLLIGQYYPQAPQVRCCHNIRMLQNCLLHQPLLLFSHHPSVSLSTKVLPSDYAMPWSTVSSVSACISRWTLSQLQNFRAGRAPQRTRRGSCGCHDNRDVTHSHQGSYKIRQTFLRKARRAWVWMPECTPVMRNKLLKLVKTSIAVS